MNVQLIDGNVGNIKPFKEGTDKFGINFSVAMYTGKDKQGQPMSRWFKCIAFGAVASGIQELGKGAPIILTSAQIFGNPDDNKATEIELADGQRKWLKEEDTWVVNDFAVKGYHWTKKYMSNTPQSGQQGQAPQQAAPAYAQQGQAPHQQAPAQPQQQAAPAYAQQGQAPQQQAPAYAQQGQAPQQQAPNYAPQGNDFDDDDVPF